MNLLHHLKRLGVSSFLCVELVACEKPGPGERAGQAVDRTVDEAGQKLDRAAEKAEEKLGAGTAKAGAEISDAELTVRIKTAFLAESGLKTLQISVTTSHGVVSLSGTVDTQAHSDMATSMAGAVSGVSQVNNQLLVTPGQ